MFRSHAISLIVAVLTAHTAAAAGGGNGSRYNHNGSIVWIEPEDGEITYSEPKTSLTDVVKSGDVLFKGHLHFPGIVESDRTTHGIAYAFKKGCPPADYPVTGSWSADNSTLILRGPGPVRSGCAVTGYSLSSPHSVLKFTNLMTD